MRLLRPLETLPLDNNLNGWTCTFFALAFSTRAKLVPKANWHTKVPRTKSRKWCSLRRHPKKRPPSESQDSRTNYRFRYIGLVWPGGVREDAWLANFMRSLASQWRTSQVLNARHGGQKSAEHRQSRRHAAMATQILVICVLMQCFGLALRHLWSFMVGSKRPTPVVLPHCDWDSPSPGGGYRCKTAGMRSWDM